MTDSELVSGVDARFIGRVSPTAPRIQAGGHPCQGIYWTPTGRRPKTALIATHYNVDFSRALQRPLFRRARVRVPGLEHALSRRRGPVHPRARADRHRRRRALAARGGRRRAAGDPRQLRRRLADGRLPGRSRRAHPGGRHAGRGRRGARLLPPADLYVSLNAHKGRPEVLTAWMDASVVDELDPTKTDPSLDPFNPDNGPPYSADFIARYRDAQRARNQRITDWAKAELARLNAAGIPDILFPLYRTWADLRFMDPAIDPSDRPCPGCYRGSPPGREPVARHRPGQQPAHLAFHVEPGDLEVPGRRRSWPRSTLPALVVQSTADMGVFPSDARGIHRGARIEGQEPGARPRRPLLRGLRGEPDGDDRSGVRLDRGAELNAKGRIRMLIKDRVVVVTGAASGIGRALARRFAGEEGAKLVVCSDRNGEGVRGRGRRDRRRRLRHQRRQGSRHPDADRARGERARADRPLLLQRRHRHRRRGRSVQRGLAADLGHQRDGARLGGAPPGPAHDRARRRLSAQHRLGRGPALADRLGPLRGDQARGGGARRMAGDHPRRPGDQGLASSARRPCARR